MYLFQVYPFSFWGPFLGNCVDSGAQGTRTANTPSEMQCSAGGREAQGYQSNSYFFQTCLPFVPLLQVSWYEHNDFVKPEIIAECDRADLVVVGPGPGDPTSKTQEKMKIVRDVIDRLHARNQVHLCVCLGHQIKCHVLGFDVCKKNVPTQVSSTRHHPLPLSATLCNPFVLCHPQTLDSLLSCSLQPSIALSHTTATLYRSAYAHSAHFFLTKSIGPNLSASLFFTRFTTIIANVENPLWKMWLYPILSNLALALMLHFVDN